VAFVRKNLLPLRLGVTKSRKKGGKGRAATRLLASFLSFSWQPPKGGFIEEEKGGGGEKGNLSDQYWYLPRLKCRGLFCWVIAYAHKS